MAERLLKFSRNFSSARTLRASLSEPLRENIETHPAGSFLIWKKLFFFLCCPVTLAVGINVYLKEEPERPEFIKYSHLRIRRKKFPWKDGVKSLFHNPHMNALPDGYEEHH